MGGDEGRAEAGPEGSGQISRVDGRVPRGGAEFLEKTVWGGEKGERHGGSASLRHLHTCSYHFKLGRVASHINASSPTVLSGPLPIFIKVNLRVPLTQTGSLHPTLWPSYGGACSWPGASPGITQRGPGDPLCFVALPPHVLPFSSHLHLSLSES